MPEQTEEDYDIVPHHELEDLKHEVEEIKRNPLQGTKTGNSLQNSVESLTKSLNSMHSLFEQASHEMKIDEDEPLMKRLKEVDKKLSSVLDQNERIARAVLTVVELLKERELQGHYDKQETQPHHVPRQPRYMHDSHTSNTGSAPIQGMGRYEQPGHGFRTQNIQSPPRAADMPQYNNYDLSEQMPPPRLNFPEEFGADSNMPEFNPRFGESKGPYVHGNITPPKMNIPPVDLKKEKKGFFSFGK